MRGTAIRAGSEYYRTIRLQYDGEKTVLMLHISKPEQDTPDGFREYLEMAARQAYEQDSIAIKAEVESGKIT